MAELDGVVVGFALWFLNFSTWRGTHGIYLEDLYVRPAARGGGLGKALLAALAAECVRNGYTRLEWVVSSWHRHRFYSARAIPWTSGRFCYRTRRDPDDRLRRTYRLTDEPLRRPGT